MNLCRAVYIAVCLLPIAAGTAAGQAPWPQQSGTEMAPWPQQQPQPPQQQSVAPWPQQQKEPPCVQNFFSLRDDASKKAQAIQQASKRKAPPVEACRLFNTFLAAEAKMIKYAQENQTTCGIPPSVIKSMSDGHGKTTELRTKVCEAAARPQGPAGPSLSDALSAPITDSNNIKTGRGTFDTLTGAPLGNR